MTDLCCCQITDHTQFRRKTLEVIGPINLIKRWPFNIKNYNLFSKYCVEKLNLRLFLIMAPGCISVTMTTMMRDVVCQINILGTTRKGITRSMHSFSHYGTRHVGKQMSSKVISRRTPRSVVTRKGPDIVHTNLIF